MKIAISIVEDNRFVREGWLAVFEPIPEFVILGAYANCEDAFESEQFGASDVVLMDIGLPGMSGIEGVRCVSEKFPDVAVVMCTVFDDDKKIFDALCNGAIGYLLKRITADDLISSIKSAASGGSPMTPNIARKVIASFQKPILKSPQKTENLTVREQEVLDLLAQGKSYSAIGKQLYLSVDGVRYHIRHIYEKLQVHTRTQAVAKGLKDRIIQPPR